MQVPEGKPITLFGEGSQTRSFCCVDDLVSGMIAMMESEPAFTGPVNLGNPVEFTIAEPAHLVLGQIGSKSPLVHEPLPTDDPSQRNPTSRWQAKCSAGSRRFRWKLVLFRRSAISGALCRQAGDDFAQELAPKIHFAAVKRLCLAWGATKRTCINGAHIQTGCTAQLLR